MLRLNIAAIVVLRNNLVSRRFHHDLPQVLDGESASPLSPGVAGAAAGLLVAGADEVSPLLPQILRKLVHAPVAARRTVG
jgi:hypothetical protein